MTTRMMFAVSAAGLLSLTLWCLPVAFAADSDGVYLSVVGDSVTIELVAVPEKYQIDDQTLLQLFTASPDSVFWCGPNQPSPHSWLTTSVVLRGKSDFRFEFCSEAGYVIETFYFTDIEPATYDIQIGKGNRPPSGFYVFRYLYKGEMVFETKIAFKDPAEIKAKKTKSEEPKARNKKYSLDTYNWDYAPWMKNFNSQVYDHWLAPHAYRLGIISGDVRLRVTVEKNGDFSKIEVIENAGHESFVSASTDAMDKTSGSLPLPPNFPHERLVITLKMHYPEFRKMEAE